MIIVLLLILGCLSLVLGILGIFLPGLPSTPFFILAIMSFLKSSPRLHKRMLESRFGGFIRKYEENYGLRPKSKIYIIVLMIIVCGIAVAFIVPSNFFRIMVGVAGMIGIVTVVYFIPTIKQ